MKKTQQMQVLELLQTQGEYGVNSYDLTYKYGIKQAPTRIKELRQAGYTITSRANKNRSVNYILVDHLKSVPQRTTVSQTKQWAFTPDGRAYQITAPQQEALL